MFFGAHISISKGVAEAPRIAAAIGCEVFQMFSRSPQGGPAPLLTKTITRQFRRACDTHKQAAWYIHTPYFINLASANPRVRFGSINVIREELERGSLLGAEAVMTHLGSARDLGERAAERIVIDGIQRILRGYAGSTRLLLEISAGAGAIVGDTFEELARILKAVDGDCGICYDTQHAFASGYDIRTRDAVKKTLNSFDRIIGINHLALSHCNDSLVPLGSRKDRHAHIGKGEIGLAGFHALIHEPRLKTINLILETPPDGVQDDLAVLKKLRRSPTFSQTK
jgi:deoxyribonuclease-4